ncbi:MAG: hypothetical protein K0T99_00615 [Alphaproteobacteria bacterium]|nr:hypothetical protein [Alphaproteobacteria bacterium]
MPTKPTTEFIEEGSCIIISEASSSKTSFFSFLVQRNKNDSLYLTKNNIDSDAEYTLLGERADDYANSIQNKTAEQYFNNVLLNKTILNHIKKSSCTKFYWGLLATGGMRNKVSQDNQQRFYDNISTLFSKLKPLCQNKEKCKNIILNKIKTITGKEEGRFAWLTINKKQSFDCFAVNDVGGETIQFADKNNSYSWSLGIDNITKQSSIVENCYAKPNNPSMSYHGDQCRNKIKEILNDHNLVKINYDDYCKIFGISNLYFYFKTFCHTYFEDIKSGKLEIPEKTFNRMDKICEDIKNKEELEIRISEYKEISDSVCSYWNEDWDIKENKYQFANRMCLLGNYAYSLLRKINLEEHHSHHIIPNKHQKEDIDISNFAWDTGAAYEMLNNKIE